MVPKPPSAKCEWPPDEDGVSFLSRTPSGINLGTIAKSDALESTRQSANRGPGTASVVLNQMPMIDCCSRPMFRRWEAYSGNVEP